MDFDLAEEQRLLLTLAQDFSRDRIVPAAAAFDRSAAFPTEIGQAAQDLGLLAVTIPQDYGGSGLGVIELTLVAEAFAHGCLGIGTALLLNALPGDAVALAGTEAQKARYLRRLAQGEMGSYALTEPGAGSDVAAIATRARRTAKGYVLNGGKIWISNAPLASFFVLFAKTDPEAGVRGITAFLVERDTPGLAVGAPLGKMGQRAAPAAEVFLTDVLVPDEAVLGAEGEGFKLAMRVFDRSRPMVAALGVGVTQRCLDLSVAYAAQRRTMGRPIAQHQAVGHKLAEMRLRLEAARLLTRQAAWLADKGRNNTVAAASAKAFACDTAMWAASETIQIFGGMGYSTDLPPEKLFRDAKVLQIYEGTSEIQRNIILRETLR